MCLSICQVILEKRNNLGRIFDLCVAKESTHKNSEFRNLNCENKQAVKQDLAGWGYICSILRPKKP